MLQDPARKRVGTVSTEKGRNTVLLYLQKRWAFFFINDLV